jgi:large subunit ribosomal protein L24e
MVSTRTCDFSGEDIEPGTGIMYVRNDGTVLHFKDRKAEKNYFMGRESRNLEWTQAGRAAKDTRRPQETEDEAETEAEAEAEEEESAGTPDLEAAEAEEAKSDEATDGSDEEDDEE